MSVYQAVRVYVANSNQYKDCELKRFKREYFEGYRARAAQVVVDGSCRRVDSRSKRLGGGERDCEGVDGREVSV